MINDTMLPCLANSRKIINVSVHFKILMLRSFDERIGRQGDLLPSRDGLIKKGQ